MKLFFIVCLFLVSNFSFALTYPNGASSAISITADDGWPTQLQQASILEEYGFRGTFYLSQGALPSVNQNIPSWRQVRINGHEVGNHSYNHYLDISGKTVSEIEIDTQNSEYWLYKNIYDNQYIDHSYSYPEGNSIIGQSDTAVHARIGTCSYASILSGAVSGARIAFGAPNYPSVVGENRYFIFAKSITGDDTTAFNSAKLAIDDGILHGSWTVLIFHSLGDAGDGNSVSKAAYRNIMNYIKSKQSVLYVNTFINVMNYIKQNTTYRMWTCSRN